MRTIVVRYQVEPEQAEENQRLVEAVFAELAERRPRGFRYQALRLDDGVSFVHVVTEHDVPDPDSLQDLPAFRAFVAGIGDRCAVQPESTPATVVGDYR